MPVSTADSPPPSTVRKPSISGRLRVWLRPTGLSWKIRAEGATARRLHAFLSGEGCSCTDVVDSHGSTGPYFFARPAADHAQDFIPQFIRSQPDLVLMHDPA